MTLNGGNVTFVEMKSFTEPTRKKLNELNVDPYY